MPRMIKQVEEIRTLLICIEKYAEEHKPSLVFHALSQIVEKADQVRWEVASTFPVMGQITLSK